LNLVAAKTPRQFSILTRKGKIQFADRLNNPYVKRAQKLNTANTEARHWTLY